MRIAALATVLASLATTSPAAAAVTLQLSSATVARPGDVGQLCVTLNSAGQEVAGTQNDLVWDGACATLADESACAVAGTHGKQLSARIQNSFDFRLRALILSLTDVDPIDDGVLYCCDFTVEAALGSCCDVGLVNPGVSDSRGNAVVALGSSAQLCVGAARETPIVTATPSVTVMPTRRSTPLENGGGPTPTRTPIGEGPRSTRTTTPRPTSDDDGCQVVAPRGLAAAPWLAVIALLLLRRRRTT
jgi:hypothetical protein